MTRARLLLLVALLALAAGIPAVVAAPAAAAPDARARGPWPEESLRLLETLPVQVEGRVKPLRTWAAYTLLRMNHRRSCTAVDGSTLSPVAWMLDVLLRPDRARRHRCFLVADSEVLDAIGLAGTVRGKRGRYSFEELSPARARLGELAAFHRAVEARERTRVEGALVALGHDVAEFESLLGALLPAERRYPVPPGEVAREALGAAGPVTLSEVLAAAPRILDALRAEDGAGGGEQDAILRLLDEASTTAAAIRVPSFVPPPADAPPNARWLDALDVATAAIHERGASRDQLAVLALVESLVASRADPAAFGVAAERLHERTRALAEARGEYGAIELEVALMRLDPFDRSLVLYLLAFVLVALAWLRPAWRWAWRAAAVVLVGALALHVTGIVIRCVIRGRPPVSTLYETVLFVTAFGVAAGLVMEWMGRRRIALSLVPVLGALGLFVANRYEAISGVDTMPRLAAVLDTNFWLATHVTCITIGYAAALLAGALAHVYLLGSAFGLRAGDRAFYREVARMVYGVIGFALIFAVVGTLLGGIWANESWGRFWGWDPKENGALLIVLGELAILHGRLGGYLRDHGVCMAAILLNIVVAFSWWGVNLLGIGLHSYGFASGVWSGLKVFYAVEGAVLLLGSAWWLRLRFRLAGEPKGRAE